MAVQACRPNTLEAEAEESIVHVQPGPHRQNGGRKGGQSQRVSW